MGFVLGYLLGRRRERPDADWAQQLDAHADELHGLIAELHQEVAVLEDAVTAARRAVPVLRPADEHERRVVADLVAALDAAEAELSSDDDDRAVQA